jgi:HEAT repeat protein
VKTGAAFDWAAFEGALFEEFRSALARLGRAHRDVRFYAVALWGVYGELDRVLTLPSLGAAVAKEGSAGGDAVVDNTEGFWGVRWNPADWQFSVIELRKRPALRLERALTREAIRDTQAHWMRVEARYLEVRIALARRLRDVAPTLLATTDDFVVFVHDQDGGYEVAALTIAPELVARFFALEEAEKRERAAVGAILVSERAAFLVTRFSHFDGVDTETAQGELLKIGEPALDALLSVLDHQEDGWNAAMLVGKIGVSRPDLVAALRRRAHESHWHATALGMLGDFDWLGRQPGAVAVHGFVAPLKAIAAGRPRPLDYRPLERFLDGADSAARELAEEELAPGSSYVPAEVGDVAEAVRALGSAHAVVRWHAASMLGERGLGEDAGKVALPALARALADPHPVVRRLAVLAIGDWKRAARRYRDDIARLGDDPDEVVRQVVEYVLRPPRA